LLGALAVPRAVHAGVSEEIRVGLIGGRGSGAVNDALGAEPRAKLVAVGDAFSDRAQAALDLLRGDEKSAPRIAVEPERVFVGFDAFKQVIDSGVDVITGRVFSQFPAPRLEFVF